MNSILKPEGKVRITKTNDFLLSTRNVNVGDEYNHFGTGISEHSSKKKFYLIIPKNGKPIVVYEDEIQIIA